MGVCKIINQKFEESTLAIQPMRDKASFTPRVVSNLLPSRFDYLWHLSVKINLKKYEGKFNI